MIIRFSDYDVEQEELTSIGLIPQYRVLLHNDDVNTMHFVVACLIKVFGFSESQAFQVMYEAHLKEVALCVTEPFEIAELHRDRLITFGLLSTIEAES